MCCTRRITSFCPPLRDGQNGEFQAEGQADPEPQDIDAFLQVLELEITTVELEAGTLTQYLTYGLGDAGYRVVCMEAQQVKVVLSAMRNKTDKNDARGLAQLLSTGWQSPLHIKSIESHQIRALLFSRKAVRTKCVDLENEIRGLFKVSGIKLPPKLRHSVKVKTDGRALQGYRREHLWDTWARYLPSDTEKAEPAEPSARVNASEVPEVPFPPPQRTAAEEVENAATILDRVLIARGDSGT